LRAALKYDSPHAAGISRRVELFGVLGRSPWRLSGSGGYESPCIDTMSTATSFGNAGWPRRLDTVDARETDVVTATVGARRGQLRALAVAELAHDLDARVRLGIFRVPRTSA
jgi:hypothetical protein